MDAGSFIGCGECAERFASRERAGRADGAVAQLGEHLLCKQGVTGSIPVSSTIHCRKAPQATPIGRFAVPAGDGVGQVF